jgi:O-methyltransferase domain/Dimerisation domain
MANPKRARAKEISQAMLLMNLVSGKYVSQAISVAAELGVADVLGNGFKSAAEIAEAVNASEDGVYRLLRALASVGLFTASGKRKFKLTPLGKLLRRDSVETVRGFSCLMGHNTAWLPWGELRHSIRTGKPAFDHVFGAPIFEYLGKTPEASAVFDGAMTSLSTFESTAVVNAYNFSGIGTIVDVAGGRGYLIAAILKANRKARGILFDLPHVTSGAAELLRERGVADRCEIVSGDFFTSVPNGADAYVMKHIIHDWDDERAGQILRTCHRAMPSGAKLLLVDVVIPTGNGLRYGKLLDLEMLVMTPRGRERTGEEFRDLLKQCGLRLARVITTATYLSVVEAVKT